MPNFLLMSEQIDWATLPLQEASIKMAKFYNTDYNIALQKNLTEDFFRHLKIIANTNMNFIMSCFGTQGSGKSYTIAMIVMEFLKYKGLKKIDLDNCCFTINDLLTVVERLEEGGVFILDEQVHTAGYGSQVERHILDNVEMTTRAHKLCFFFLAPKFFVHNFHYFIETWQMGTEGEWDWNKSIDKQWMYTKSILFDHRQHMLGYIITNTPEDKEFLKAYDAKKNNFINEVRMRRGSGRHQYIMDKAYALLEDEIFFERFVRSKGNDLKRLNMLIALKGELMSTDESKMLLSYIKWAIQEEPKFVNKAKIIKGKQGIF